MRRDSRNMHFPGAEPKKEQDVIGDEPSERPDLGREEVGGHQHLQVRADKLLPGGRRLPLWSRRDAMALEDVAHRLVADRQAQVGQGADNPVIAPGAMLLGHTHDQGLQLWINPGASRRLALRRAVKLLGHKRVVPAEHRVGLDQRGHVLQGLLPQFLTDLGQGLALASAESYASLDVAA
jgi:hypothetical protein